jgi:hypothetical protein
VLLKSLHTCAKVNIQLCVECLHDNCEGIECVNLVLFKRWSWIFESHFTPKIEEVLNIFILIFPFADQKRLVSSCGPELITNCLAIYKEPLYHLKENNQTLMK